MKIRSRQGKRRLRIATLVASCLCLLAAILIMMPLISEMGNRPYEKEKEVSGESEQLPHISAVPTELPQYQAERTAAYTAAEIQKELLGLSTDTIPYGKEYREGRLISNALIGLFYEEYGEQIDLSKVSVGDIATGNGYDGICVGFYEGIPVFAYIGAHSLNEKEDSCVFLGFDRSVKDDVLFGRYPIEFSAYYDTCSGDGDKEAFSACMEYLKEKESWYADTIYSYGKLLSENRPDEAAAYINEQELTNSNRKLIREEFDAFIRNFGKEHGCSGSFNLYVDHVYDFSGYYVFSVRTISMDAPDYFHTYGEAEVRISSSGAIYPVGNLVENGSRCGIVQSVDILLTDNKDGTYSTMRNEMEYGGFYDEYGRYAYRDRDGNVFFLEDGEELIIDPEHEAEANPYLAEVLRKLQEEERAEENQP